MQSLSFYILHLNNLIPDLFETWNLKFNSTLHSWCVFNSDDIIEAPDQTDCIHDLKAESILSLILSTKKLHEQWNPTLRGFQIQTSFSKNNICITFMTCFWLCRYLTSMKTKIIWKHTLKKKPTFVLSLSFIDITPTL